MTITANATAITFPDSTTQTTSGAPFIKGQVFTANGTFTIPSGVTALKVTVVGGGAGGQNNGASGNGGGGGGTAISYLTGLTPGSTLTVTRGAGGAAAANGVSSTVSSGTQSISTITGGGGVTNGAGGTATGGSINLSGMSGTINNNVTGFGGMSSMGFGWQKSNGDLVYSGVNYGSGGIGCSFTDYNAQAGSNGIIIFEW
jgi:hypothetical protein